MRKASLQVCLICSISFASFAAVVACSSSDTPTLATGNKDSGTSGSSGSSGEVDARNPFPSFRDDVVPIVQESCALTACHSSKESNLGIFLTDDKAQILTELMKTSPTSMKPFVIPGDAVNSYIMVKLENRQATLNASCTNMTCGTMMPPDTALDATKIDTFRKWIAAGAKDD